jgi:hypothetical protein
MMRLPEKVPAGIPARAQLRTLHFLIRAFNQHPITAYSEDSEHASAGPVHFAFKILLINR